METKLTQHINSDRVSALPTLTTRMTIDFERQQFLWSRTKKEGDHLIWTGANTPRGYGKMSFGADRIEYAHRVAWCIDKNLDLDDIEGVAIIRLCDRNDCVAPGHLV